jgi:hypothetical protein
VKNNKGDAPASKQRCCPLMIPLHKKTLPKPFVLGKVFYINHLICFVPEFIAYIFGSVIIHCYFRVGGEFPANVN